MKRAVILSILLTSAFGASAQAAPFRGLTQKEMGMGLTTTQFLNNTQLSDDMRIGYINGVYQSGVYFEKLGNDSCRPSDGTIVRNIAYRVLDDLKNNASYYGEKPVITAIFEDLCGKK